MRSDAYPQFAVTRRAALGGALASGLLAHPAFARGKPALLDARVAAHWPKVAGLLRAYVDSRKLPGAAATFGWGHGKDALLALGTGTFDSGPALGPDSLFRIYSMTKPVTGLLACMLIEEGKLGLDTRLAEVCPEFTQMQVAIDPKAGLQSRPATVPITVRHLLTHTAGFGYAGIGREKVSAELARQGLITGRITRLAIPAINSPVPVPPPDEFLKRLALVPLVAEPGTAWRYSMSLDVLGLVLERVTGRPLDALMHERILGPAGMKDTGFRLKSSQSARLTTNYAVFNGLPLALDKPANSVFLDPPPFAFGGAGLVSTPRDFDRFMRVLLSDGQIGGKRVVSAAAVRLATSNLLPPGAATKGTQIEGAGFGAGGRVGLGVDEGSFGWSGAAGTLFFVQRRLGLRGGLYAQFMPPEVYPLQKEFLAAARADALAGKARP